MTSDVSMERSLRTEGDDVDVEHNDIDQHQITRKSEVSRNDHGELVEEMEKVDEGACLRESGQDRCEKTTVNNNYQETGPSSVSINKVESQMKSAEGSCEGVESYLQYLKQSQVYSDEHKPAIAENHVKPDNEGNQSDISDPKNMLENRR